MSISDWLEKQGRWVAPPDVTIRHKGYEQQQESIKFWVTVVVVILIAIGLGVGLYFVFKNPSSSPSSPSSPPSSTQSYSEKYEQENKRRSMNSAFSRGGISKGNKSA